VLLFSATYGPKVLIFAEEIIPNALWLQLRQGEESLENIKQYYVLCKKENEKYKAITNIYSVITIGQAIIFCHVSSLFD